MFTFKKHERLRSPQIINETLSKGIVIYAHPFKLYYLIHESKTKQSTVEIAVSVPKRIFKKAISRNRVKRLIREAYRLNKPEFLSSINIENKSISLFLIYIDRNIPDFETTNVKIKLLLHKLTHKLNLKS